MRKFMILQLGLILALASSNAFAIGKEAPAHERGAKVEDGVSGHRVEDAEAAREHAAGVKASAGAAERVRDANKQSEGDEPSK